MGHLFQTQCTAPVCKWVSMIVKVHLNRYACEVRIDGSVRSFFFLFITIPGQSLSQRKPIVNSHSLLYAIVMVILISKLRLGGLQARKSVLAQN